MPKYEREIEIAPGRWLSIASDYEFSERSNLSLEWNGIAVYWRGNEIPLSLREHDGMLYMIGLNREDMQKLYLRYYSLNRNGSSFERISIKEYPKRIATQNMWLKTGRYVRIGLNDVKVDNWKILRELDTKSIGFGHSWTAKIWYQLEKDTELYDMPFVIEQSFAEEFKRKYSPIALPTIIRDDQTPKRTKSLPDIKFELRQ